MALGLLDGRRVRKFSLTGKESVLYFGSSSGRSAHRLSRFLEKHGGKLTILDTPSVRDKKTKRVAEALTPPALPIFFEIDDLTCDTYDVIFVDSSLHGVEFCKREATVEALALALRGDGRLILKESIEFGSGLPLHVLIDLMAASGLKEVSFKISGLPLHGRAYTGVYRKAETALAGLRLKLTPRDFSVHELDYAL